MKTFSKLIVSAFALCGFWACGDNDHGNNDPIPEPVTYASVAGIWQLTQWNGEAFNDSRYCYLVLDRKDRVFEIYQNLDSSRARHITGTYELKEDEYLGVLFEGEYDHGLGFLNNIYVISMPTGESMKWVVSDDPADVSVYTRCASVPENILNGDSL